MPPYIPRECPKCQNLNSYDALDLLNSLLPIYRSLAKSIQKEHEYPVKCKKCGHEFIIQVNDNELGR